MPLPSIQVRFFVLCLLVAALVTACSRSNPPSASSEADDINTRNAKKILPHYIELEKRERAFDQTVWSKDILAQRCGRTVENLWDAINATAANKLEILENLAVGEMRLPNLGAPVHLRHDIQIFDPSGAGRALTRAEWAQWLRTLRADGWELGKVEFRHTRFDPSSSGNAPGSSEFYMCGELARPAQNLAATIEGTITVQWDSLPAGDDPPTIRSIDASRVSLRTRSGGASFERVIDEAFAPIEKSFFIDPLILYDLDGDGRSEIILAARNLRLQLEDWKIKQATPLCRIDPGVIFTDVIADFNNDGHADFLCAKADGLLLYEGSAQGSFDREPRPVWTANPKLKYALAITCGDIDGDGDLDIWLTQYKVPYLLGQLPTPYYDANDGHPSYLLRNDGHGNFTDATAESGLEAHRQRRTYSASFVDLDEDGDLDLVVVSDFCGIDLYRNDGKGRFTDVTREWAGETYADGMAHAVSDFNRDGRLDLLAMGMTSPTVDRLEHLGLKRNDGKVDESKRAKMTSGNRLLVARPGGGFEQTALSQSIARSGWSWGVVGIDFDNDSFVDAYVATGQETKQSVREFEPQFWLHDIYVANSAEDAVHLTYFATTAAATRGRGYSYGGWERNRFFWNDHGEKFIETGHLLGLSLQEDSRCVVADDLDGDGRVDLLVTTFEEWPQRKQTLKIFRNKLADAGNWIGVRLVEQGNGLSPVGAVVRLESNGYRTVRTIVTGDSYRSQHANTVHFGLGTATNADSINIRWSNGSKFEIRNPPINRYHEIRLPK